MAFLELGSTMSMTSFLSKIKNFFTVPPFIISRSSILSKGKNTKHLSSVINKNIAGLVVSDFISEEVRKKLVIDLERLSDKLKTDTPFGRIYGKTLVGTGNQMSEYFVQSNLLNKQVIEILKFDFRHKIEALFEGNGSVQLAKFEEGNYAIGTFRGFNPNCGGLHAHAEAEFMSYLPEFEGIRKNTDVGTAFNYLLILEDAELGGELELYDLYWQDSPETLKGKYEFRNHYKFREDILQQYRRQKINLRAGDLFLFNGVNIWHGVSEIRGKRTRKTFAGFIAKSTVNDDFVIYN